MACVASGQQPGNVQFNYAQLEGLWIKAGGNPTYANLAAAVAMAESSGNSADYCQDSDGSIDRGLWQINSVHGPAQSTYDIMANARAAVAISNNGRDWSAWTTYTSGKYQQYLQGNVPPQEAPINGTNAAANIGQGTLTSSNCDNWVLAFNPGLCIAQTEFGNYVGKNVSKEGETLAIAIVKMVVKSIINPSIQLFGGIMGMAGGGILMIAGIYLIVADSKYGQEIKQDYGKAKGLGTKAAALFAAPETGGASLAATQGGGGGGGQQRVPRQQQPPSQAQILRNETQRYTEYNKSYRAWLRAGGGQPAKQPAPSTNGSK